MIYISTIRFSAIHRFISNLYFLSSVADIATKELVTKVSNNWSRVETVLNRTKRAKVTKLRLTLQYNTGNEIFNHVLTNTTSRDWSSTQTDYFNKEPKTCLHIFKHQLRFFCYFHTTASILGTLIHVIIYLHFTNLYADHVTNYEL